MTNVSNWRIKFEAQGDVSKMPGITSLGKDVHFQLVSHYNIDTRRCFPSEQRLAKCVGKSVRSVRDGLKHLQERGVISIRSRGGRNGTNQYDLHVLERKLSAYRPEEKRTDERKLSADKQEKEHRKEKEARALGRSQSGESVVSTGSQDPPLAHELVTNAENVDAWYDLASTLNIGSPTKVLELTHSKDGYRLPSQVPNNETGSRSTARAFFLRVLTSGGLCFA